jgi:hypothetical protein
VPLISNGPTPWGCKNTSLPSLGGENSFFTGRKRTYTDSIYMKKNPADIEAKHPGFWSEIGCPLCCDCEGCQFRVTFDEERPVSGLYQGNEFFDNDDMPDNGCYFDESDDRYLANHENYVSVIASHTGKERARVEFFDATTSVYRFTSPRIRHALNGTEIKTNWEGSEGSEGSYFFEFTNRSCSIQRIDVELSDQAGTKSIYACNCMGFDERNANFRSS